MLQGAENVYTMPVTHLLWMKLPDVHELKFSMGTVTKILR